MSPAPIGFGDTTAWLMPQDKGRKVVATPGTALQIASNNASGIFLLQALHTNQGNVMVGDSDVDISAGNENGIELEPGQTFTLPVRDPSQWYIDADNANDGVSFIILG